MSHVSRVTTHHADAVYANADAPAVSETDATLAGESLLPMPNSASGDAVTDIAILLAKLALSDRKDSRMQALLDDQRAVRAGLARVSALRAAADDRLYAGLVKGLGEVATGGLQLTGVAMELGGSNDSDVKILEGAGKAGDGVNQVFAALLEHDASMADAHAAKKEVEAGSAVRAHDAARADAQSAQELYDRLVQAFKEVTETHNAALLAAVRG